MARKRRKPSSIVLLLLGAMIVFGVALVGMTVLEIPLEITSLSILLQTGFCQPDSIDCSVRPAGSSSIFTDGRPPVIILPLNEIDTNSPMILDFQGGPIRSGSFAVPPECESFVTEDIVVNMKDGINLIQVIQEGITDIQPLLLPNQQTLVLEFEGGICQPNFDDGLRSITYSLTGVTTPFGTGQAKFDFLQKPPEVEEFRNPLLAQHQFLSDYRDQSVVEKAQRFAVAESFQLTAPTVITDLKIRMGSELRQSERALDTQITAFVWNIDATPPERIVQSTNTFTGITRDIDLDFTFQNVVVLLPEDNNNNQITYAVGFRVDQNLGQEFVYTQSNQTAATHECVIDRNSQMDSENPFVPNGLCGFDIQHSQFKASQILDEIDIDTPIIDLDPLSRPELIALLCEGVSPEPEICQGDILILNANSCGVTEFFFEGSCLCAPNYDRNEAGDCQLREVPSLLKIGDFSEEELVIIGLGLLILVIGAVGILAVIRR